MNFLVVAGRLAGGFTFYGPFETEAECDRFIERIRIATPWTHCEIVGCLDPRIF